MSSSSSSSSRPLVVIPSSVNIDETFAVRSIVRPGETISSTGLTSRPGGKGANVSAALALAGCDAWFVGNVGKDADWPLEELRKRGVKTDLAGVLEDTPTGRAFIQIAEDGENSIVLLKGANYPPTPSSPSSTFSSLPRAATHLVLQNEIPLSTTAAYLSHGHSQGLSTIWNPSPLPTTEELKAWKWDQTDVLIVNQGEGLDLIAALTGREVNEEEKAEDTLAALAGLEQLKTLTWIVMTRGAHGVLASVLLDKSPSPEGERTTVSLAASKPKQVLDTTGAGDTFAGYLVSSLAELHEEKSKAADGAASEGAGAGAGPRRRPSSEEEVRRCLHRAGVAAAMAVEVRGAMESIPKREDVQARLEKE